MAETLIIGILDSLSKRALNQLLNTHARPVPTSSQTQQQPYRRPRGRIVPGSGNQKVAAQYPPKSTSDPLVTETTSAAQVPKNPSPSGEGSSDPSVTETTSAAQVPKKLSPSGEGSSDPSGTETTSAAQVPKNPSPSGEGSSRHAPMGDELFEASTEGNVLRLRNLVDDHGSDILFTVTPYGNSPLHLAVMLGHDQEFVMEVCNQAPSLLSFENDHKETPLIAALMAHNKSLAFLLIEYAEKRHSQSKSTGDSEKGNPLKDMLMVCDRRKESALHHALRNGFEDLAITIVRKESSLSEEVNKNGESAMHMACRKGFSEVVDAMLKLQSPSHAGPNGQSALDAATEAQNIGMQTSFYFNRHYLRDRIIEYIILIFCNGLMISHLIINKSRNFFLDACK
jgi:hypothetical protein